MSLETLNGLMSRWLTLGLSGLSEAEQQACRAFYLALLGNPPGCTTCPDFWEDCKMGLRNHLKKQGYSMKTNNFKYRLRGKSGSLRVPYVNIHLTPETMMDEVVEKVLAGRPEYLGQLIELNPDYVPPIPAEDEQGSEEQTDDQGEEQTGSEAATITADNLPEGVAISEEGILSGMPTETTVTIPEGDTVTVTASAPTKPKRSHKKKK